jgi:uncharacterized membrane protein YhiD involved in acid resistance
MDELTRAANEALPAILAGQMQMLLRALMALPFAAALGAVLAFRPRRRGTPPRSASVIQTQIILAVVGTVVMLVVGSSLARAFGIVGAANLIRYRAKIDDPKDAVVMLSTLTIGLTVGVELYGLAILTTAFLLVVLWVIESAEPDRRKTFELKVTTEEPADLRNRVEAILRRHHIEYELRTLGQKDLVYETELPMEVRTDRVASAIRALREAHDTEVIWDEKKKKN